MTLTDKEVGELWARRGDFYHSGVADDPIGNLIHKLVEERAKSYCDTTPICYLHMHHTAAALHDFGIDSETW